MELFISLGMEMGSWIETTKRLFFTKEERKYYIMLKGEKKELSVDEYNLWILGQEATFTPERASEHLRKDMDFIEKQLEKMAEKGFIVFWKADIVTKLDLYTLTPRGNAGMVNEIGYQTLISHANAKPEAVDTLTHQLWMCSNGAIPLSNVALAVKDGVGCSQEEIEKGLYASIPLLIRLGLAVLNPKT